MITNTSACRVCLRPSDPHNVHVLGVVVATGYDILGLEYLPEYRSESLPEHFVWFPGYVLGRAQLY